MLRLQRTILVALVASSTFASACSDDEEPPRIDLTEGATRVSVQLDPFALTIFDADGSELLSTLSGGGDDPYGGPAATRDDGPDNIRVLPGWDGYVPEERPWRHGGRAHVVAQTPNTASLALDAADGSIAVEIALEPGKVRIKTTAAGPAEQENAWNKATISFALREDDHFFGLGERFATLDHRGVSLYAWAEEGGTGKGERVPFGPQNPFPNGPSMTYFPVPFFMSSAGYAVHLATTYRTETHFGSERPDAWRVAVNAPSLETIVYVNRDPLALLDAFTRDTGRPFVPATWVFGPRRRVSRGDTVGGVPEIEMLRQRKVPTTGVDDAVHFLPARSELGIEDELRAWTTRAHELGYKVMAYNNPYVSISIPTGKEDLDHGTANGFFAMTPDGKIAETHFISGAPQQLATIDLTNPQAFLWFQDLLRRTLALGYDGWMHDFGEYVRRPWRFHDGRTGDAVHNEFPVLSAKAAHDLLTKERPGDFLFFVRAGYTGTQQYVPAVWGGDPEATFDETQGLPAMLRGGLNLGMSGVPLWGSDITGFKCLTDYPNDKEMVLRWAEMGAVSPIMMEQNACSNPVNPKRKWKLWDDDETVEVYGAMSRLHTRLAPYFEVLAREAHATGIPIMRHPFLLHPREPAVWSAHSTFYLGPSLWAAPVVERGATTKETWLPPGKWIDLFDQVVYEGGQRVTIPAPLQKLPLLLADGGIVPMLDASIDTLAPATDPTVVTPETVKDRLDVLVALTPGKEARFVLADGTELVAKRQPAAGAPSGLAPGDPQTCTDGCVEDTPSRVRLSTPLVPAHSVVHGDLVLETKGPIARRVRWDVFRLP